MQAQTHENYVYATAGFSFISLDACIRLGSRFSWYKHGIMMVIVLWMSDGSWGYLEESVLTHMGVCWICR